ncbi:MAG: hypothetical protein WC459_05045 [Patescibacteria group bacterium]
MKLICLECKNEINLSNYPNLAAGHVIECDICGITLQIVSIDGEEVKTEVVDEGK